MPELPEVETLCRQLKQVILHEVLQELVVLDNKLNHMGKISGTTIHAIKRQGKFLLFGLDENLTLSLHLRMSGRLLWQRLEDALPAHSRFMMVFPQGKLVCADPRRFATLTLEDGKRRMPLIPDPLKSFSASMLYDMAKGRRAPIKTFLLNQDVIAGIGNIYACEMLHKAAINPLRSAGSLSISDWQKLASAGQAVLHLATECRGTSISDWRDLYGKTGEYQRHLSVYGREGLPCTRCGGAVLRIPLSGRGTYFCDRCQL